MQSTGCLCMRHLIQAGQGTSLYCRSRPLMSTQAGVAEGYVWRNPIPFRLCQALKCSDSWELLEITRIAGTRMGVCDFLGNRISTCGHCISSSRMRKLYYRTIPSVVFLSVVNLKKTFDRFPRNMFDPQQLIYLLKTLDRYVRITEFIPFSLDFGSQLLVRNPGVCDFHGFATHLSGI